MPARSQRRRILTAVTALLLFAGACGSSATTTTAGQTETETAIVESSETESSETDPSDAPVAEAPQATTVASVQPAVAAVVPNDICTADAVLAGVLDPAYFEASALGAPDPLKFGRTFDAQRWLDDETPLQSCTYDLDAGATLTVFSRFWDDTWSLEPYETATINGTPVEMILQGEKTRYARIYFDEPASPNGKAVFVLQYSPAEPGEVGDAILKTLMERVIGNVSYVSPAS